MSVNITFTLAVTGLKDEAQAREVVRSLDEVMEDERVQDQVNLGVAWDEDGTAFVSGETDFPLSITRFHLWQPQFESYVKFAVDEVAPEAKLTLDWGYPDLER
ncbi:hypothetical protein E2C00_10270 [Streptomyces sp. WAC05374]|uniref:hypothetical protein n=1 Tax=Streptomyces sp. WAC05374 TaxID=2487420 RepID=UPI000F877C8E|nr:hypothetical protein [Streptomyces sp. WAC05374]RST11665.1 hypothetical protein EF905_24575 [Streptomyces sp. WAC05374]TDF47164.1 hypothetical protein E2B92_09095 [Streptomyces sp. WAC05374]TDF57422.1 hypothetical protein E2C00_10270 [Streptomyces sp. WAC05374]TDF61527.1 hypothetical protein E2C02_01470 [Streptomyces sp. WAC05374]